MAEVFLYKNEDRSLNIGEIEQRLISLFPRTNISVRPPFIEHHLKEDRLGELARELAGARITDQFKERDKPPLKIEARAEERTLGRKNCPAAFYDGYRLMRSLLGLLPPSEIGRSHVHIAFTNILAGTLDDRYHARTVLLGYPSVISVTGLVEAPAKPKAYYLEMEARKQVGNPLPPTPREIDGDWLWEGDPRVVRVAGGYALQAMFHSLFGEVFCEKPDCALYNAHWQEDMLRAQLYSEETLCPRHREMLEEAEREAAEDS